MNFLKLLLALPIAIFFKLTSNKHKNIWLIGERNDEAKDNGYHLFKYIRKNFKQEKVYYVIDKNSDHLERVQSIGETIYYNTIKHYIYFLLASKLISAFQGSNFPKLKVLLYLDRLGIFRKNKFYIKHGIVKEKMSSLVYSKRKFKMISCGSPREADFFVTELGYPKSVIKSIGLCRFDNLHDNQLKKQILIMPTWRYWLNDLDKKTFKETEYFKTYKSLIKNTSFHDFLSKNNLNAVFYFHKQFQKYNDILKVNSNNIIIADEGFDVQTLLKESEILITDYSSVSFDFGYMRKPVIYYQFDEEEYYKKHYQRGYFDYTKDSFGPVVKKQKDILLNLEKLVSEYSFREEYKEHCKIFFPIHDKLNCKRTYEEIKKIK